MLPAKVSETVSRSCGDRVFLNLPTLQRRIASIGEINGLGPCMKWSGALNFKVSVAKYLGIYNISLLKLSVAICCWV